MTCCWGEWFSVQLNLEPEIFTGILSEFNLTCILSYEESKLCHCWRYQSVRSCSNLWPYKSADFTIINENKYGNGASISRSWLVAAPLRFYAKPLFLFVFYATMSRPKIFCLNINRSLCWRVYDISFYLICKTFYFYAS